MFEIITEKEVDEFFEENHNYTYRGDKELVCREIKKLVERVTIRTLKQIVEVMEESCTSNLTERG